jgi:hypothetical protein
MSAKDSGEMLVRSKPGGKRNIKDRVAGLRQQCFRMLNAAVKHKLMRSFPSSFTEQTAEVRWTQSHIAGKFV